jgi:nitrate reductase gamma subunit
VKVTDTHQPQQPQLNRRVLAPEGGSAIALVVVGILLFLGGWGLVAMAPAWSTVDTLLSSDIVNTPSLVQKSAGGVMAAAVGAVLFAAGLVMMRVEAWARWLRATGSTPGN